jgi:hypothetical protein
MRNDLNESILDDFARSDSGPMVAAALHILAGMADDAGARHHVVGPWAWDLRQRARQLAGEGRSAAATQAKIIARVVGAVALGQIASAELARAAASVEVDDHDFRHALAVLELAMQRDVEVVA